VDEFYIVSMAVANFSAAAMLGLITWMSPFTIVPAIVGGASKSLERVIRGVAAETRPLGQIHKAPPPSVVAPTQQPQSEASTQKESLPQ